MRRLLILPLFVILCTTGCKTLEIMSQIGTSVAVATGNMSASQAHSVNRSSKAVGKTLDKITPEQEYYIGRSVGATILGEYKPYNNKQVNTYLNVIGQTLAMASDKPETFGGYHFLAMDTDEINAFAAPGGLIFVSRGLLKLCDSEDAVAAVLAHEIGHVQYEHGLGAIKKSRLTSAFTILAAEGAKNFGGAELAQLTTAFEGTIGDITATMVNSGYARKFETQADTAAVTILKRVGYNPNGLKSLLTNMKKHLKNDKKGFGKTHPDPEDRISDIESLIGREPAVRSPKARQTRFARIMKQI